MTVTVRAAVAAEPPVVPCGNAGEGTAAQPSFAGNTSRAGSDGGRRPGGSDEQETDGQQVGQNPREAR